MYIIIFLKFLLVLFSIWSYGIILSKKFDIKIEFGMVISIASIISILYLFSLINLLMPITIILFILGVTLGIILLIKYRLTLLRDFITIPILFGFGLILFLFFTLTSIKILHFDNFSHWLLIISQMLEFNNLPNNDNILTTYFDYPPGSSYFIYYCCLFASNSEFAMLLGQVILEILLLIPIFNFIKDKERKNPYVILGLFMIFCLVINISVGDLLVDSLLGITAISSFMFLYFYKDNLRKMLLLLIPINLMLLLMKNSAIFFFGLEFIYVLYLCFKTNDKLKAKIINILVFIIPFVLFVLWKIRNKIVFAGLVSAQSVSLSSYQTNFSGKTYEDIIQIIKNFVMNLVDVSNLYLIIILCSILLLIVYYFQFRKNIAFKTIIKIILLVGFIYLSYAFSLLFAYIFSMSLDEALRLACFDRYIYSVVIFIVSLLLCLYFASSKYSAIINTIISVGFILIIMFSKNSLILLGVQDFENSKRHEVDSIFENVNLNSDDNIFVIASVTNVDGYYKFLMTYYLNTKKYTMISDTNTLNNYNIDEYDYVVTLDTDSKVKSFLKDATTYDGNKGVYEVKHND